MENLKRTFWATQYLLIPLVPLLHYKSPIGATTTIPQSHRERKMEVAQSCPTLCHCIVHGILQSRILEWVAFPFSRNLPNPGIKPRSPALQADSLPAEPQPPKPMRALPAGVRPLPHPHVGVLLTPHWL